MLGCCKYKDIYKYSVQCNYLYISIRNKEYDIWNFVILEKLVKYFFFMFKIEMFFKVLFVFELNNKKVLGMVRMVMYLYLVVVDFFFLFQNLLLIVCGDEWFLINNLKKLGVIQEIGFWIYL